MIMRGQALLHACIRLDAQGRAHISTLHQSTVALQRDVTAAVYVQGEQLHPCASVYSELRMLQEQRHACIASYACRGGEAADCVYRALWGACGE
eukprot:9491791-Pyramimonas_sp.AAC.3